MSAKPVWYRWARVFVVGGAIIGTGVTLFKFTVPTDEQLIAQFSPEIKEEYLKNRELRRREQQALMELVKETSASKDPIWMTGKIKSPFEREGRNTDPRLATMEDSYRTEGEDARREEVLKASAELSETEELLKRKKSWWTFWK
ncbi:Piso0_001695 [Millerozyma farinosa CBS 7064]|uniref:Cytochrome b mRNA-processing protein 4 n=1 Tax=Pichia sorbitophila (strain ATCC MYA-4447 / BCRC 22081 / CBS 7064 / NBRC 10061 / NRRL Y-12695) TaxID=559304 RepID=G8YNV0_PICSO|nr:Piso0_001695 [Millerozyma farinosa CBS 7064]